MANVKQLLKNRDGQVLFAAFESSVKGLVEQAVKTKANLRSANLTSADLRSADLRSANLTSANLRSADLRSADLTSADLTSADLTSADLYLADLYLAILPTGERWEEYLSQVVPALLVSKGKQFKKVVCSEVWERPVWKGGPLSEAFGCSDFEGVPTLLRPRVEQFEQFFNAKIISVDKVKELAGSQSIRVGLVNNTQDVEPFVKRNRRFRYDL